MNGALKAAWALTAFVVLAGIVLWIVTGRPVFAVFIVLGVLTGIGALVTGRSRARRRAPPREHRHAGRLRRGPHPLRAGHRPGDPRRARHRLQDVLRLLDHVRRRAQHPDLPGLPGPARLAAGGQRRRDRGDDPDRPRAGLPDRHLVAASPGRTTSTRTSPRASRPASTTSRCAPPGTWTSRSTARPTASRSSGCTSRRTPARTCTSVAPPAASTAPTTR